MNQPSVGEGMMEQGLLPTHQPVGMIDATDENRHHDLKIVATRDHELIRRWAGRRQAEPATGEATASGPATLDVNDQGGGVRFNFPGVQRFRSIDWDEWFTNFDTFSLVFVYEREAAGASLSYRYRLLPHDRLTHLADVRE
jgi:hypothetical protein